MDSNEIIALTRRAMLRADTWLERWNIMCDPDVYAGASRPVTLDECRTLEEWARNRWQNWDKDKEQGLVKGNF